MGHLYILHGDNATTSRNQVGEYISKATAQQLPITHIEGKHITTAALESALSAQELFATKKLVVLTELLTGPASNLKKSLAAIITKNLPQATDTTLLIWESKKLTATALKPFLELKPTITENKLSSALFTWLDSLSGSYTPTSLKHSLTLLHTAVQQDGAFTCLSMFSRQTRMLIAAKEKQPIAGPPFMIQKLSKQATTFSLEKLLKLHQALAHLDYQYKTSSPSVSLAAALDLLILNK